MAEIKSLSHERVVKWFADKEKSDLPTWDEFPALELYMDQVVSLLAQYLQNIEPTVGTDKQITPAMVNNYVKMKLIPPPIKKRYGRAHLVCLIMLCILKRTLSMVEIQKLVPITMEEDDLKNYYESFCESRRRGVAYGMQQIMSEFEAKNTDNLEINSLAISYAVTSSLYKSFSERILGKETEATND